MTAIDQSQATIVSKDILNSDMYLHSDTFCAGKSPVPSHHWQSFSLFVALISAFIHNFDIYIDITY